MDNKIKYCETNREKQIPIILEVSLINIQEGVRHTLSTIPSICIQHIISYLNYEEVARMREVCRAFDEAGKEVLNKGYIELKKKLRKEIQSVRSNVLATLYHRPYYSMFHFLTDMYNAMYNCTRTYYIYFDLDKYYFAAGKVLDEANRLLKDFNSSTTLSYVIDHVCLQRPHPLLNPFIQLTNSAYQHFDNLYLTSDRIHKLNLRLKAVYNRRKIETEMVKTIKVLEIKTWIAEQTNKNLQTDIQRLNKIVQDLAQEITKTDKELEKFNKCTYKASVQDCGSNCSLELLISMQNLSHKKSDIFSDNRFNFGTLPSLCIENILSYFAYKEVSQLRVVCKSFNEACKKVLNQGFENFILKAEFGIKYNNLFLTAFQISKYWRGSYIQHKIPKDIVTYLMHCRDIYKWHLEDKYYFIAGKVLDEAICQLKQSSMYYTLDNRYAYRPHYNLFELMTLVHKAITHFKFNIVPKYYRMTKKRTYIPGFLASGEMVRCSWKKERDEKLEEMETIISKQKKKINYLNQKNKKCFQIISGLKKSVEIVNQEVSDRRIRFSVCKYWMNAILLEKNFNKNQF